MVILTVKIIVKYNNNPNKSDYTINCKIQFQLFFNGWEFNWLCTHLAPRITSKTLLAIHYTQYTLTVQALDYLLFVQGEGCN